jgi:hypothetical protein
VVSGDILDRVVVSVLQHPGGRASVCGGMPLPYVRWSTVSSIEYFWMPTVFILNLAILFAVAFPFVSWAVGKIASPKQNLRRGLVSVTGAILVLTFGAWMYLRIQTGLYKVPVSNIASETYPQFRPIRLGFKTLRYDCTKSEFWFEKKP